MIDEKLTLERFGYLSADLSPKSTKKVIAVCDDCGKVRERAKYAYRPRCAQCVGHNQGMLNDLPGWHKKYPGARRTQQLGKTQSPETKLKRKLSRKDYTHSLETRQKIGRAQKAFRASMTPEEQLEYTKRLYAAQKNAFTSYELKLIQIIERNNLPFSFVGDGKVWLTSKGEHLNPDFIHVAKEKIAIEVFSDYWKIDFYGSVEEYITKRTELFEAIGWKVIFFGDKEVRDFNFETIVVDKLLQLVNN